MTLKYTLGLLLILSSTAFTEEQASSATQPQVTTTEVEQQFLILTPPEAWQASDPEKLLPSVKMMVVGKGAYEFPPSINIGTEVYSGTLKAYLKRVKEINTLKGAGFKDLGPLYLQCGVASLSQVDKKTEWGNIRMMHVIFKKDDTIYIVTASARKEEFPDFYKDFFNSLKSLRFTNEKQRVQ